MDDDPDCVPQMSRVPARIEAAMDFLDFVARKQDPGDSGIRGQDITPTYRAAENAALQCLSLYFLGEQDYGDVPCIATDDPQVTVYLQEEVVAGEASQ